VHSLKNVANHKTLKKFELLEGKKVREVKKLRKMREEKQRKNLSHQPSSIV
jgi:hypothetical protein